MRALILFTLILAQTAWAEASEPTCRAVAWPYAAPTDVRELRQALPDLERTAVQSYFFHGVTQTENAALTRNLGKYLVGTETRKNLRSFYKLLMDASGLKNPNNRVTNALKLGEVCDLYSKTLHLKH